MVVVSEKKRHLATETVEAQPPSKKPLEGENAETMLKEAVEAVEKEMSDNRQFGNQRLLSEIIVVNDELELALREARGSNENPTIAEGVAMVHKRLQSILSKEGVEKIQSLGSKFNPDLHDAALRVVSDEEEGTIVEEVRQGYTLKGKVLRPSIVKVAENPVERESKSEKSALEEIGDNE